MSDYVIQTPSGAVFRGPEVHILAEQAFAAEAKSFHQARRVRLAHDQGKRILDAALASLSEYVAKDESFWRTLHRAREDRSYHQAFLRAADRNEEAFRRLQTAWDIEKLKQVPRETFRAHPLGRVLQK